MLYVCEDGQLSTEVRAVLTWIVEVDMRSGGQMEVRIIFGFSCETVEQQTVDQTAIHKAGFDIWLLRQEQCDPELSKQLPEQALSERGSRGSAQGFLLPPRSAEASQTLIWGDCWRRSLTERRGDVRYL
jgi:hypothetical protein